MHPKTLLLCFLPVPQTKLIMHQDDLPQRLNNYITLCSLKIQLITFLFIVIIRP